MNHDQLAALQRHADLNDLDYDIGLDQFYGVIIEWIDLPEGYYENDEFADDLRSYAEMLNDGAEALWRE